MESAKVLGQFFTAQQLSEHRSLTPEGFMLISAVPVCRTGQQVYSSQELPSVTPSMDGLIIVDRDPEEVFRPETIASFNGKPLTNDHPPIGMLTPDNWRDYARGVVLNPRRGDGLRFDADFMYADLLVTDRDTIEAINAGKKEVSAGYDASYEGNKPGRARCMDIVGNHIALVDKGRCGPYCAVGDSANVVNIGDSEMAVKSSTRSKFLDRFRSAVSRGNTRDALEAVSEVAHDPEALGEIISDEMAGGIGSGVGETGEASGKHHIEVHTHLNGMPGASVSTGGPANKDEVDPNAGSAGGTGGGDVETKINALSQRLDNIEKILMSLADEEGGEGGEGGEGDMIGDRRVGDRHSRDEESIPAEVAEKTWRKGGKEDQGSGYHENLGAPELPKEHPVVDGKTATGDRRMVVTDSAFMREAFIATLSKAETLCPGIRLPTFDSASPAKETADALCSFRRKTLDAAYKAEESRVAIDSVIEGRKAQFFDREWTCDAIAVAFNGAASLMAQKNQHRAVHPRVGGSGGSNSFGSRPPTPAEMNAKARSFFKQDA